jgi:hypothetical protein
MEKSDVGAREVVSGELAGTKMCGGRPPLSAAKCSDESPKRE